MLSCVYIAPHGTVDLNKTTGAAKLPEGNKYLLKLMPYSFEKLKCIINMSANISNNLSGFSCSIAVFVKLVWSNELRHCVHDFL